MFHVKHTMLHKDFNWEKIKLEELIDLATVFIYLLLIFPTWQYDCLHPNNSTTLSNSVTKSL